MDDAPKRGRGRPSTGEAMVKLSLRVEPDLLAACKAAPDEKLREILRAGLA